MTSAGLMTSCFAALAAIMPAGAVAQTLQAPSIGGMSATQVGAEPAMKVPTPRYVAEADALDAWVVAADRLAAGRSHDAAVLAFARMSAAAHLTALHRRGGTAATAPDWAARLNRLWTASGTDFDRLFIADQIAAHRRLWSLHAGYAVDGADPRLKRLAAADVSMEERDLHNLPMRPMPY